MIEFFKATTSAEAVARFNNRTRNAESWRSLEAVLHSHPGLWRFQPPPSLHEQGQKRNKPDKEPSEKVPDCQATAVRRSMPRVPQVGMVSYLSGCWRWWLNDYVVFPVRQGRLSSVDKVYDMCCCLQSSLAA